MLVAENFVFIHLPRTGGTFVSELIKSFFPSAREIGYHMPRMMLPKEYAHLPVLGCVRNPWEFYVSWYQHQMSQTKHSALFCGISDNRKLDFVETTRNALNLGVNDRKLARLLQELPEEFDFKNRHVPNVTKESIQTIRGTGIGLFTFRFNFMFNPVEDVFFCRVESLRSDLLRFLENVGASHERLRKAVLNLAKQNVSCHRHYSTYYTAELAELVAIRDRDLIKRFGYTFERPKPEGDGNREFPVERTLA